jgi:hypothetical protein
VLRPYLVRQREVDTAIVDALHEIALTLEGRVERLERSGQLIAAVAKRASSGGGAVAALAAAVDDLGPRLERLESEGLRPGTLNLEDVLDTDTAIGSFWLDSADTLITPLVREHDRGSRTSRRSSGARCGRERPSSTSAPTLAIPGRRLRAHRARALLRQR